MINHTNGAVIKMQKTDLELAQMQMENLGYKGKYIKCANKGCFPCRNLTQNLTTPLDLPQMK